MKPGGYLIYDPNGITHEPTRKDINIYKIAATAKAQELGISKVFNMVVLGGSKVWSTPCPSATGTSFPRTRKLSRLVKASSKPSKCCKPSPIKPEVSRGTSGFYI